MKVRLETNDGELVHDGVIPPFNEWPAVILWGVRVFTKYEGGADLFGEPAIYREAFAYYLV